MSRIDFGNIYKFAVSAGVVLILASALVPWFFFGSVSVLAYSDAQLDRMTPVARDLILRRQDFLSLFQERFLPLLVLATLSVGIGLVVWGWRRWLVRQARDDERDDVGLEVDKVAFMKATIGEKEEDLAREVGENEGVREAPREARSALDEGADDEALEKRRAAAARRDRLQEIERRVGVLANDAYGAAYSVFTDMVAQRTDGMRLITDVVLDPPEGSVFAQLAIDVTVIENRMQVYRTRERLLRLALASNSLATGKVYTGRPGRPPQAAVRGVLMVVVDESPDSGNAGALSRGTLAAVTSAVSRELVAINQVLRSPLGLVLVSSADFETWTASQMRDELAAAWVSARM